MNEIDDIISSAESTRDYIEELEKQIEELESQIYGLDGVLLKAQSLAETIFLEGVAQRLQDYRNGRGNLEI